VPEPPREDKSGLAIEAHTRSRDEIHRLGLLSRMSTVQAQSQ
jgi:hypothetical protein